MSDPAFQELGGPLQQFLRGRKEGLILGRLHPKHTLPVKSCDREAGDTYDPLERRGGVARPQNRTSGEG